MTATIAKFPRGERHFDNWLKAYMDYSEHSEAPDIIHFWAGVSAVAGSLGRKVWIDELKFKWVPNFYIIFVAPPGIATKSTSVDMSIGILQHVEDIKFGPDSMTWQGLTMALQDAKAAVEVGDIILQHSSITCAIGELGTFLKTSDSDLVSVLVDLWDCRRRMWRHRIKTGDNPITEILNPWINVIGCTTPAWMRKHFNTEIIEGGLTSRCIFVFANAKRRLVPYPSLEVQASAFYNTERRLIDDLKRISTLKGQYSYSPEAREWGVHWYTNHWGGSPPADIGDRYSGYLARKQTHIHKLAIVMAAAHRDELSIELEDLEEAERMVTGIEKETQELFRRIGATSQARLAQDILSFIQVSGGAEERNIWRMFMPYMSLKELKDCLAGLSASGHIIRVGSETGDLAYLPFAERSE